MTHFKSVTVFGVMVNTRDLCAGTLKNNLKHSESLLSTFIVNLQTCISYLITLTRTLCYG